MPQAAHFSSSNFGERDAVVFLHDAIVMIEQVFGDLGDGFGAFGIPVPPDLFPRWLFRFNFRALDARHVLPLLSELCRRP